MTPSLTLPSLITLIQSHNITSSPSSHPLLVAIAGPPAAGKTTLARQVHEQLSSLEPSIPSVVIPFDGFHLDDNLLLTRQLLDRKGAPHTFDAGGFAALLDRVKNSDEEEIFFPIFERSTELSRAAAGVFCRAIHRVVICEGNYILCRIAPWKRISEFFDLKVRVNVERAIIKERLYTRWHDLKKSEEEITRRIEENDLRNADFINSNFILEDFHVYFASLE